MKDFRWWEARPSRYWTLLHIWKTLDHRIPFANKTFYAYFMLQRWFAFWKLCILLAALFGRTKAEPWAKYWCLYANVHSVTDLTGNMSWGLQGGGLKQSREKLTEKKFGIQFLFFFFLLFVKNPNKMKGI